MVLASSVHFLGWFYQQQIRPQLVRIDVFANIVIRHLLDEVRCRIQTCRKQNLRSKIAFREHQEDFFCQMWTVHLAFVIYIRVVKTPGNLYNHAPIILIATQISDVEV